MKNILESKKWKKHPSFSYLDVGEVEGRNGNDVSQVVLPCYRQACQQWLASLCRITCPIIQLRFQQEYSKNIDKQNIMGKWKYGIYIVH